MGVPARVVGAGTVGSVGSAVSSGRVVPVVGSSVVGSGTVVGELVSGSGVVGSAGVSGAVVVGAGVVAGACCSVPVSVVVVVDVVVGSSGLIVR